MKSGCHAKRLSVSRVTLEKSGIAFDHALHFGELRRGIKLHCRSCHSDIVQGEHVKVSKNVCYLCHFKGAKPGEAVTGCPSCHTAPKDAIKVDGRSFSHTAALKAGKKCGQCHIQITRGEGMTPRDKCFFCHLDRTEKYPDVKLLHARHVGDKQIDCLYCHSRIEHGKIRMAADIPL